MKHLLAATLLTSVLTTAFAAETTTDCIMMRERNERSNPKLSLSQPKGKPAKPKSTLSNAQ